LWLRRLSSDRQRDERSRDDNSTDSSVHRALRRSSTVPVRALAHRTRPHRRRFPILGTIGQRVSLNAARRRPRLPPLGRVAPGLPRAVAPRLALRRTVPARSGRLPALVRMDSRQRGPSRRGHLHAHLRAAVLRLSRLRVLDFRRALARRLVPAAPDRMDRRPGRLPAPFREPGPQADRPAEDPAPAPAVSERQSPGRKQSRRP
jgi:hypothetical protein